MHLEIIDSGVHSPRSYLLDFVFDNMPMNLAIGNLFISVGIGDELSDVCQLNG